MRVFFLSVILAALLGCASAQVQEGSLEKGQIEDLTGIVKVYVGTFKQSTSPSTMPKIIETVRKKLPQIVFVSAREQAEVWLLFSEEMGPETEDNPTSSLEGRSSLRYVTILRSEGRVIRVRGPDPAKIVKKFSATGKSGDANKLARDFAEEFIRLYLKANPGKRSDLTPHPDSAANPGPFTVGMTTASPDEPRLNNTSSQKPESPPEKGTIDDLRGVARVYVGAPDHYSSLFLRRIVETIQKKIPQLIFVWARDEADVWLLFSVESNVRDAGVHGQIIRSAGRGQLRLIKQYSGKGNKGADSFAEEFVKAYQAANLVSPAAARQKDSTGLPPRLVTEAGGTAIAGVSPVRSAGNAEEGEVLRIDTSLVTLYANVVGRDGKPAPEMRQDDFSVYEDDVKQEIAYFETIERPFTVILMIDSSISVEAELNEIARAGKLLIDRLRPDDQLVVVTFDAAVNEVLKLTRIKELRGESIRIVPHGGTRLYDAVDYAASQYLGRLPGRKAVLLLSDGIDFGSFVTTAERSLHDAEEYDALFYTIQYRTSEPNSDRRKAEEAYAQATSYLRELAEKTGGKYQRAEGVRDLAPTFASVVKNLSSQYSLGYYPKRQPQPGERRRIRVRVSNPDLLIHTRDSYVSKSVDTGQIQPK